MPCSRANSSPAASARFEITAATRAFQPSVAQARTMASMFEPRPETRMTIRFTGRAVYLSPWSACLECRAMKQRVLSGMRPTGALHLGHYHGALKNWVRLQDDYDCYYFVADWHALTTHYEDHADLERNVYDMVVDWLAAGIDPDKSTLFIQSRLPEHAELFTLLAMGTPISWLERVPSYKDQSKSLVGHDLATYGFLGYPLLQ